MKCLRGLASVHAVWGKIGGRHLASVGSRAVGDSATIGKRTLVDQVDVDAALLPTPVQCRAPAEAASPVATPADIARRGTAGAGTPLPHVDRIQACFGRHDISGVTAHQGGAAGEASRALGASAFAFGNAVAFAGEPDLHTAAHEAAHVIQQRGGVQLKGGIDQAGDPHERHADAVADAVVAGRSAVPLLDAYSCAGGSPVVQRKNTITTPDGLPDPPPPATIPPPTGESSVDAEGNKIVQDGGHWHLAEPPKSLSFPIAPGFRYQLLPINPNTAYAALRARVVAIRAEQLAYVNGLKGDMKYWFARVYYFVTTHELAAIDAGTYLYPHMKMEEVAQFHAAYKANIDAWQAGNKSKVEAHWKKAFESAERENGGTWYKPRSMELMAALLPSMEAHIRFDLPRAIAACYVLHYAGIPGTSINDFKRDFDAMGPVFDRAQASLLGEIKDDTWLIDPGHYGGVQDLGFPFIFSVPQEREHTFEKASNLATSLQNGDSNKQFIATMRAETAGAHPFSGKDDFEVDGTDVGQGYGRRVRDPCVALRPDQSHQAWHGTPAAQNTQSKPTERGSQVMFGRKTIALVAAMVAATLIAGCMKATSPQSAAQIDQLIQHLETVAQWSREPDRKQHMAWLDRAIAWDIVGAVDMTVAADKLDESRVDAVLNSGLAELAAGPGDHIASLVMHWRKALGSGSCRRGATSDDDVRWARERLTMPIPPRGAGPDVRRTLTSYAERARDTHDFVRVDCGGTSHLVVGMLGDRLVPILHDPA